MKQCNSDKMRLVICLAILCVVYLALVEGKSTGKNNNDEKGKLNKSSSSEESLESPKESIETKQNKNKDKGQNKEESGIQNKPTKVKKSPEESDESSEESREGKQKKNKNENKNKAQNTESWSQKKVNKAKSLKWWHSENSDERSKKPHGGGRWWNSNDQEEEEEEEEVIIADGGNYICPDDTEDEEDEEEEGQVTQEWVRCRKAFGRGWCLQPVEQDQQDDGEVIDTESVFYCPDDDDDGDDTPDEYNARLCKNPHYWVRKFYKMISLGSWWRKRLCKADQVGSRGAPHGSYNAVSIYRLFAQHRPPSLKELFAVVY